MKFLLIAIAAPLLLAAATPSYECTGKANPERGTNVDFKIVVKPAAVGGKVTIFAKDISKEFATVLELVTIDRAYQLEAFNSIIGLIHEVDVSGVPPVSLGQIERIKGFRAETAGGDEVFVWQLFSKMGQIGGTVMGGGQATHCAP